MQNSFIFLQVGENNLGHHHSIMEALCKVVTGERNDFIFHFDNWVKQIPGSSAKVLCPHSYPRDLLSNQEMLQGERSSLFSVTSCNWDGEAQRKRGQLWPRAPACSLVSRETCPDCPGPCVLSRAQAELTVQGASSPTVLGRVSLGFFFVEWFYLTLKFNLLVEGFERVQYSRFDPWVRKMPWGGHGNHASILAWRIPWIEEAGRLQSLGSQRVRHDWSDLAHLQYSPLLHAWVLSWEIRQKSRQKKRNTTNSLIKLTVENGAYICRQWAS